MTKVSNTSYFFLKKEKCYMSVGPHFPALKGGLWNKLGITYRRQLGSPGHRRLRVVGISRVRLGAGRDGTGFGSRLHLKSLDVRRRFFFLGNLNQPGLGSFSYRVIEV